LYYIFAYFFDIYHKIISRIKIWSEAVEKAQVLKSQTL
jgi:hypothetical protein